MVKNWVGIELGGYSRRERTMFESQGKQKMKKEKKKNLPIKKSKPITMLQGVKHGTLTSSIKL